MLNCVWKVNNCARPLDGNKKALKAKVVKLEKTLMEKHIREKHPRYLEGEEAALYHYDMIFAQEYAKYNRRIILDLILVLFGEDTIVPSRIIESTHNYIDFDDQIWRKGAIRSDKDQYIIIALNMRDGVLIARGKGNSEWNNSAPHGSGRKVPRNQAYLNTNLKEFKSQMQDVYSKSVVKETIDESPNMYKKTSLITERVSGTCDVVAHLKPIINIKGW